MQDTQLMKGILEGCVLLVIAKGETYGYEILSELASDGFDNLLEGTLYPMLARLEKNGYISCRKAKSPLGPLRKYYKVTVAGKRYLNEFMENYIKITKSADRVLFNGEDRLVTSF